MKFVYYGLQEPLRFENGVEYLVIEKPDEFFNLVSNITHAINGEITEIVLTDEKGDEYSLSKCADIITDYVSFSPNDKKIITALHKKLQAEFNEEVLSETLADAIRNIMKLLDGIIIDSDFDLVYDESIELSDLFKICNLRINQDYTTLLEKIISYIDVKTALQRLKILFLVDAGGYFTKKDLDELSKHCRYKKVNLMFLESTIRKNIPKETARIIDADLCEFTIAIE